MAVAAVAAVAVAAVAVAVEADAEAREAMADAARSTSTARSRGGGIVVAGVVRLYAKVALEYSAACTRMMALCYVCACGCTEALQ